MKKLLKILLYILLGLLLILIIVYIFFYIKWSRASTANLNLLGEPAPTLTLDGWTFRDLNKNGRLDPYEDIRVDMEQRIDNLMSQMNLEEKAGLLFITMITMNPDGLPTEVPTFKDPMTFAFDSNSELVAKRKMNHFNLIQTYSPQVMLTWHNNIQKMAERTRLGIPVTVASDPRHGAVDNPGAGIETPAFSAWPSPLGFAAIDDTLLTREFGDIARQEYRAIGLRLALSPMADLSTEPRWGRTDGTFGEDAALSARLTKAYVLGFQGDSLQANSVACMTKHFPGGGPQKDGEDAHFSYGAEQVYPGNNFAYHLEPFEAAFAAGTAQIMPYYGLPVGQTSEAVAFGYNKEIITGLLRERYQYDGVVCTDWGIVSDMFVKPASAWGVEDLSTKQRVAKVLDAGCDMFGGEAIPDQVIALVEEGQISEDRLDVSVRRVLRDKFRLGLFDQPYLEEAGLDILDNATYAAKGLEAQRRSLVLLKNEDNVLPLSQSTKIYIQGMEEKMVSKFSSVVADPQDADVIILKLSTPFEPRSTHLLERFFKQGRLDFPAEEKAELLELINAKPTITVMTVQRPPVFPEINAASKGVIADFYCSDEVILELIFGRFQPSGKLPIEIPASVQAVEQQLEDVPYDSEAPLYPFGAGLNAF